MDTDGKRTRIEMRKVDPDMSQDAKQIRAGLMKLKIKINRIITIMTGLRNLLMVRAKYKANGLTLCKSLHYGVQRIKVDQVMRREALTSDLLKKVRSKDQITNQ